MLRLATALSLCVVGCGVRFSDSPAGVGGSDATGAGAGSDGGSGGSGGDISNQGGGGSTPSPASLTVCANTNDYGLDGYYMPDNADKLTSLANFGPTAPCAVTLSVVFIAAPDVREANLIAQGCDIFQIGLAEAEAGADPGLYTLDMAQVTELRNWSLAPGHVVLGAQGYASAWGDYMGSSGAVNPMVPPGGGSPLFSGPFGNATGVFQGGSWQGKYYSLPPGQFCPLVEDSAGMVVAFSDRQSGDVFLADVDIISQLGGVTTGSGIDSNNDRLFANLYAFLAQLSRDAVTDPCP